MGSFAQKAILYKVDSCVQDSLKTGIAMYEKMYKKPWNKLNLAVVVEERDGEFDFILQEHSNMPPGGILDFIKYSNRLLLLDKNIKLPVLLSADRLSEGIREDRIAFIPLTGYHVKVIYESGQQKVVHAGLTF
ncbi:hypothetical protein [Chitinophaga sp.]|uniref:hypothetical protein n=1 Tax=Chitinophaga sp. TaxID=1869181 RepID=UPI0031D4B97F